MKISHLPRKLVSAVRRVSRAAASAARRFYFNVLSGENISLAGTVELSAGVRLRATDGGAIVLRDGVHLSRGVTIVAQGGTVELGEDVLIGEWSMLVAKQSIVIGADALVAERVTIRDQDHETHGIDNVPLAQAGFRVSPVLIGSNVWIAAGAVVLKGVTVGDGAVVAANAVAVNNVAERSVVGGIPAREIGNRNADTGRQG